MKLPHFGQVDENDLEEFYDASIELDGNEVELDLNFEETSVEAEVLSQVAKALDDLPRFVEQAWSAVLADWQLGDESETVRDYVDHHRDALEPDEFQQAFGSGEVTPDSLRTSLEVVRIGIYPEVEDAYLLVDFQLSGIDSNYLISVAFDATGKIDSINMES